MSVATRFAADLCWASSFYEIIAKSLSFNDAQAAKTVVLSNLYSRNRCDRIALETLALDLSQNRLLKLTLGVFVGRGPLGSQGYSDGAPTRGFSTTIRIRRREQSVARKAPLSNALIRRK